MNNGISIVTEEGKITFSRLFVQDNQKKGTQTLELKQVVKKHTTYPSIRISNDKQDNLFNMSEFGDEGEGKSFTSTDTRVAWMPVPVSITEEQAQKVIDAANAQGARIYRVLSNYPILTSDQVSALSNHLGDYSLDKAANSQVVRYGQDAVDKNTGISLAGQLTLDNMKRVQYRRCYFSLPAKEDVDERGGKPEYRTPEMALELVGATAVSAEQVI